jgi:hypothetical protein
MPVGGVFDAAQAAGEKGRRVEGARALASPRNHPRPPLALDRALLLRPPTHPTPSAPPFPRLPDLTNTGRDQASSLHSMLGGGGWFQKVTGGRPVRAIVSPLTRRAGRAGARPPAPRA